MDNVKGLIVFFFIITNIYFNAKLSFKMPEWSIHEGNVVGMPFWGYLNFSLMDLGPAAFFFLIGLTVFPVFSKHVERDGTRAAYKQFFMKNMAIVGIFCTLTFIKSKVLNENFDWDTIQSVGFTGVLLMPFMSAFMRKHTLARLIAGLGVLVLFHIFHKEIYIFHGYQGGLSACVGYLGIVLIASALADAMKKGILPYAAASAFIIGAAVLSDKLTGKSVFFEDYNTTYMLMSTAFLNTAYFVFYTIDKFLLKGKRIPILSTMGRNIFFYLILSLLIMAVIMVFMADIRLNEGQLIMLEVGTVAVYALISIFLEKKNITFKL
ncbi:MAG: hypothetical protein LBP62_05625 [Clostridiales bacterium]|nr:hypothetical protein [Clostridiales bacterium]